MTYRERYKAKLDKMERQRRDFLQRGHYVQAANLSADIKHIEELLAEADAYEESTRPKPLSETMTREEIDQTGVIPLLIECHLVADFLTEVAYMVTDNLKAIGITDVEFMPTLNNLLKNSEKFAGDLAKISPDLCELITNNETFNASLHKKFTKYIHQRIK